MRIPNKKARRLASLFCWAYVHQKPPDEFIKISGVFFEKERLKRQKIAK